MVNVCDVGSMPPEIPPNELREGAGRWQSLAQYTRYGKGYESACGFGEYVTSGLIDKLRAGVDACARAASSARNLPNPLLVH